MVPNEGEQLVPNRVLKKLIEDLTVRCKNGACRELDDEPDRQRRRLNNNEASATDDVCPWTGKLADWPAHSESECSFKTVVYTARLLVRVSMHQERHGPAHCR
jgi:hypothetical protein